MNLKDHLITSQWTENGCYHLDKSEYQIEVQDIVKFIQYQRRQFGVSDADITQMLMEQLG
jgi:DNA-binding IscR family transcriptional regulator